MMVPATMAACHRQPASATANAILLAAEEKAIGGWAEVGLQSRLVTSPIGRRVGSLALEAVLDRIERRVGRGLRADLGAWLVEGADSTKAWG
jgi:hypothetical protein